MRASQLYRQPEPFLGVAQRVKEFVDHVRERYSQWVAVRHNNRLMPALDALWKRDRVDFVVNAQHLLNQARRGLGFGGAAMAPAMAGGPGVGMGESFLPVTAAAEAGRPSWVSRVEAVGFEPEEREEEHDIER